MSKTERFKVPVTRKRIGELFTTCMEGGVSRSWLHGAEIARGTSPEAHAVYDYGNRARVTTGKRPLVWWGHEAVWETDGLTVELRYDREEDPEGSGRGKIHIRITDFVRGFVAMAEAGGLHCEILGKVLGEDYDAEDADIWLQSVVFGKIVYG